MKSANNLGFDAKFQIKILKNGWPRIEPLETPASTLSNEKS